MTYCRKCGVQLEENARFCHKCGTEVVVFTLPQTPPTVTLQVTQTFPASTTTPTEPSKPHSKKTFSTPTIIALVAVIIIFIVVSVFVFAALFANMNQANNNQANVNEDSFLRSGLRVQADICAQSIWSKSAFTFLSSGGFKLVHPPPLSWR